LIHFYKSFSDKMEFIIEAIDENKSLKDIFADKGDIHLNNAGGKSEEIPLHHAVLKRNLQAVEDILDEGADINVKNNENKTALTVLGENGGYNNGSGFSEHDDIPIIKLLLDRGSEISDDALINPLGNYQYQIIRLLLRHDLGRVLDFGDKNHLGYFDINGEDDLDILSYFLNHPNFEFESQEFLEYGHKQTFVKAYHTAIKKYMEMKEWETAIKLVVLIDCPVEKWRRFEEDYKGDDDESNVLTEIVANMNDFTFVDSKGIKLIDMIFKTYIEEIKRLDTNFGKKLLDLGADKQLLMAEFLKCLNREGNYKYNDSGVEKVLEKVFETGIELDSSHILEEEDDDNEDEKIRINMTDKVYLFSVKFGIPKVVKGAIEQGADIFIYFNSSTRKNSVELSVMASYMASGHDECLEIILREIMKRNNLSNFKMTPTATKFQQKIDPKSMQLKEKSVVDYIKENGKTQILSLIGFLPKSPRNLSVIHKDLGCTLKWDSEEQDEFKVTGYKVEVLEYTETEDYQKEIKNILNENEVFAWIWKENPEIEEEIDDQLSSIYSASYTAAKLLLGDLLESCDEYPVTKRRVDLALRKQCGMKPDQWETMCELIGADETSVHLYPLKHGSKTKFRVFAKNENGFSEPPTVEKEYQAVTVKPEAPGKPYIKIDDEDMIITWSESEKADLTGVTMYRVEGQTEAGEWKVLGKVSHKLDKKLKVHNYAKFQITVVRVIAVNEDGESVPRESNA